MNQYSNLKITLDEEQVDRLLEAYNMWAAIEDDIEYEDYDKIRQQVDQICEDIGFQIMLKIKDLPF